MSTRSIYEYHIIHERILLQINSIDNSQSNWLYIREGMRGICLHFIVLVEIGKPIAVKMNEFTDLCLCTYSMGMALAIHRALTICWQINQ